MTDVSERPPPTTGSAAPAARAVAATRPGRVVGLVAEREIGVIGIQATILQRVGVELVV